MRLFGFIVMIFLLPAFPVLAAEGSVDIRAFGDAGYIAGLGAVGVPEDDWVATRLAAMEPLRSNDVNFMNLEGALARSCSTFADKDYAFVIAPEALAAFARWGFNLIGMANNHTLDCLEPAPERESASALDVVRKLVPGLAAHGIAPSRAALRSRPALMTVNGLKLGMVALKAWSGGRRATIGNLDNRAAIMRGLANSPVDVRILSLHGGVENSRRPTSEVMAVAREFVARYDGDIVFAHHPHASQGFEVLSKPDGRVAVIFYSLGNWLHNGLSANGDGLVARVRVSKAGVEGASLAVFPVLRPAARPRQLKASELSDMATTLGASSASIATRPLPRTLRRVPFKLSRTGDPLPGFTLDLGQPVASASKGSVDSRHRVARNPAARVAAGGASPRYWQPAARWIPPQGGSGVQLQGAH